MTNFMEIKITLFEDLDFVVETSNSYQKMAERFHLINLEEDPEKILDDMFLSISENTSEHVISNLENFVTADWHGDMPIMLCVKCEKPFNIDPCKEGNIILCDKKKVFVPKCPHCGADDLEV